MMRSHFSPARTSSFRIVVWWTSVTRSTLETVVAFEQEPEDHLGFLDWQIHAV